MADDNTFGGFTNPGYVTPEQIAQQRQIVTQLLSGAIAPDAKHWTGALAHALMGLRGGNLMNEANQGQRNILQQGANAIQGAGQNNPYAGVITGQNPTSPQASNSGGLGDGNALKAAILMQESGNNPNIRSSYAGAVGPGQIMPQTFASIAKPGESINDATDNRNVSGRLLDKYTQDYGGDPARAAVAYYSGPGNVAPPGSPTPWIRDISRDKAGNPIKPVSSYVADVTRRMGGQQVAQNGGGGLANFYMTPGIPQELKDNVLKGNTPSGVSDVYGRPGVRLGVMGQTQGLPVTGPFQSGVLVPGNVSAGGATVGTQVPLTAPTGNQPQALQSQIQPLMDTAKSMGQQGAALGATSDNVKLAVDNAYQTIPIRQTLATMRDDIMSHGDKMVWGPTADWVNNLKRSIAQHAPGFLNKGDLEGIASADSFEKLSAQLQTLVGRQVGPTDASLFQGMKSVPGSHNSKEGALALIDMLDQQAKQNGEFMIQNQAKIGQPGFDLLKARNDYFEKNPIINPITHNPIRLDLTGNAPAQTKTLNGKNYQKLNGIWHEVM